MNRVAKRKYQKTTKGRAAQARWRAKNPDYYKRKAKEAREQHPDRLREIRYKHRYGFVPPPAPANCEACSRPFSEVSAHHGACVDHDHKTGAFRGWLCNDCNLSIGRAGESRDRLQLLINYLDKAELLS
jgi:uncharacterized protein with PIN domain